MIRTFDPTSGSGLIVFSLAICLTFVTAPVEVQGNPWKEMLLSLPAEANAVALIDLDQLRNAVTEKGNDQEMAPVIERIDKIVPRTIRRMVIAASVNLDTLEADWEVSVGNITKSRSIENLAESLDGYVDEIEKEKVVRSKRGFYVRMVDPSKIGLLQPADRRLLSKWIRNTKDFALAPALAEVVDKPHDRDALFLALDLTDAISRRAVRDRLETSELPNLPSRDFDRAANDVSSVRLISFSASVQHGLRGRCSVQFAHKPSLSADVLKGLLLEVLDRRGATMPDLATWNARVEEFSLILSGPLSAGGMDDVVSFLSSPGLLSHQELNISHAEESRSDSPDQQAARATKAYFHSVTSIVDRLRNGSAKTQGQRAMWNDRYARQIDQLPILYVDPEMLDFGSKVSVLLRGSGRVIRESNLQVGASKNQSSYNDGNYYAVNDNQAYNAQLQAHARLKGTGTYLSNLEEIDNRAAAIRRAMTMKYKVEF